VVLSKVASYFSQTERCLKTLLGKIAGDKLVRRSVKTPPDHQLSIPKSQEMRIFQAGKEVKQPASLARNRVLKMLSSKFYTR
jgi:hypothetical protein